MPLTLTLIDNWSRLVFDYSRHRLLSTLKRMIEHCFIVPYITKPTTVAEETTTAAEGATQNGHGRSQQTSENNIIVTESPMVIFPKQCPVPLKRHNSVLSYTGRDFGDVAAYACEVGSIFPEGGSTRTLVCKFDGQWSGEVKGCERKLARGYKRTPTTQSGFGTWEVNSSSLPAKNINTRIILGTT